MALPTYLSFFHFEEPDSVAQQLQILLGPLSSDLGSTELLVKGRIVILFVRGQVHLIVVKLVLLGALVVGLEVVVVGTADHVLPIVLTVDVLVVHIANKSKLLKDAFQLIIVLNNKI